MLRFLTVLILPLTALSALVLFGANQLYRYALRAPSFELRNIEIENPGKLSREAVLKIAGLEGNLNTLAVNLDEVKRRLEDFSTIHTVTAAKVLPDTVRLQIVPEVPEAIVNTNALYYVNREGKIYDRVHAGDALSLPLIQIEGGGEPKEKTQRRLERALEIVAWTKNSKLLKTVEIGDILVKNESYEGMAPLEMTVAFPGGASRNSNKPHFLMVSFAEENLPKQLQRLEVVLNEMLQRRKIPTKIRMELDKKVVVKIAQ